MNEYNGTKVGNYEYKNFQNALWLKIFYHNVNYASYTKKEDALSSNIKGRYSILKKAKSLQHYGNNFYEFLLQYPELTGYNRWQQTKYPLDETSDSSGTKVSGYKEISVSWTSSSWGGLALSTCVCSLIDGSPGELWFYSIGMKANCSSYYSFYFPGPNDRQSEVYLWMRVSSFISHNQKTLICKRPNNFLVANILIILIVFT